jgi:hypothetical protein
MCMADATAPSGCSAIGGCDVNTMEITTAVIHFVYTPYMVIAKRNSSNAVIAAKRRMPSASLDCEKRPVEKTHVHNARKRM